MEKAQRGAAKTQQGMDTVISSLVWDDLRILLDCASEKSFRSAGRKLGMDPATVVRRIERLERMLGAQFFNRLPDGVRLTEAGARAVEQARIMEQAAFAVARASQVDTEEIRGQVKVAVTEGLGTYWILPRLIDFQRTHRLLTIEMDCAMTPTDVGRLEADISIQFDRAERPDVIAVRLAYLHIYPFASRGYARTFGLPTTVQEVAAHRLIQQVGPMIDADLREIGATSLDGIVGFKTNGSTAVLYAIERDAGIGFLPSYASALAPNLIPVDLGIRRRIEVWMSYHPDLRQSRRHMLVIEWLRKIFDAQRFPCFAEKFIHPNDLAPILSEVAQVNHGAGYSAPSPRGG